jgi:VWFA-related protein
MRLVLLLFLILSSSFSLAAQQLPEWYRVYTFDNSVIEMNTSLVTLISNDVARVRFRWTFDQPEVLSGAPELTYTSRLEVMELNCSLQQYRPYHFTFFDAAGHIVRIQDSPGEWRRVAYGSMMQKLFGPACELVKKRTRPEVVSSDKIRLQETAPPKKPDPVEVGEDDVLRVDTTLVGVPVTVLDRDGRFVPGLKREDFHVYEDGEEQPIAYFASIEANVTVLLLFDTFVKGYRNTAKAFTESMGIGDKVLVAKFGDSRYEILTKVGEGPAGVRKDERAVKWRFDKGIHDAVDAAIRRMNGIPGRKAILLFSDGLLPSIDTITERGGSLISMRVEKPGERATAPRTISEAEESDAPFYVMQYDTMTDAQRHGPSPKYSEVLNAGIIMSRQEYLIAGEYLQALAEKSGGRIYQVASGTRLHQVDNPPGLPQAFTQISAELRQQYSLGYYPQSDKAKEPHQIMVRVARPDVVVRSRTSYAPVPSRH